LENSCSIKGGAKFKNASANRLEPARVPRSARRGHQQDNAVEFASTDTTRKRHAERMKDFAARVSAPGLDRRDNFL